MKSFFRRSATLAALIAVCVGPAGASETNPYTIHVSVSKQRLWLLRGGKAVRQYPVSTSKYGVGSREGSNRTPLGRHLIAKKIGDGAAPLTVFRDRKATPRVAAVNIKGVPTGEDLVTTRILWLTGIEKGKNRGPGIDSFKRTIYIHGTPDEGLVGRPASHGCVRMKNRDVIELYEAVPVGTPVEILL